ncbi:MAG: hypothetical protein Q7T03_02975 [Deltaproteobacteria bacterium]|nr:hypothetical protein [Deltaproteobacteria bacterium]
MGLILPLNFLGTLIPNPLTLPFAQGEGFQNTIVDATLPAWMIEAVAGRLPSNTSALWRAADTTIGPGLSKPDALFPQAPTTPPEATRTPSTKGLTLKVKDLNPEAVAMDLFTWYVTARQPRKAIISLDISAIASQVDSKWFAALKAAIETKFTETQIVHWEIRFDPAHSAVQNFAMGLGRPLYRLSLSEQEVLNPDNMNLLARRLQRNMASGRMAEGLVITLDKPAQNKPLVQNPLAITWPLVLALTTNHPESFPLRQVFWVILKNADSSGIINYGVVRKEHAVRIFMWDKEGRRWDILEINIDDRHFHLLAMRKKTNKTGAFVYMDPQLAVLVNLQLWQQFLQQAILIVARRDGL